VNDYGEAAAARYNPLPDLSRFDKLTKKGNARRPDLSRFDKLTKKGNAIK